jgi:hypothetical protein
MESGASLEVFVPFNARWLRSRYPGRPASGRSRFDVGPCAGPALRGPAGLTPPLRFSALTDNVAMSLRGGRAARAFQSNPSFARSAGVRLSEASPLCLA